MGDIKIEKIPELFLDPETEQEEMQEEADDSSKEGKRILIGSLLIIILFALFFISFFFYNNIFTTAGVINVDDLHKKNLQDELGKDEGYIYNGFSFVKADGLWWTELNKFGVLLKIPLHFGPKEVEFIDVVGTLEKSFNEGSNVYIAIDPNVYNKYYTLAVSELSFNLAKGMDRVPVGSCTQQSIDCENRTIISCNNSQGKPVIELSLEEKAGIELSGACIKLSGDKYDLVKAVDRLLYQWYGVMN